MAVLENYIGSPRLPYADQYSHGVWIGGQRRNLEQCNSPFVWKTLTGIEVPFNFTNWRTGEPNCGRYKDENCVHIAPGFGHVWNDLNCNYLYFALCEL